EIEHGVELVHRFDALAQAFEGNAERGGDLALPGLVVRQELVQRWIQRPNRHRAAVHDAEEAGKVGALQGEELRERGAPLLRRAGEDGSAHWARLSRSE